MLLGIHVFPTEHSIQPDELARAAEERGLESIWFSETLLIEPLVYIVYMKAVLEDFLSAQGKVVVRDCPDLKTVLELPEPVIMNCSGLGAKFLFDNEEMYPIKGLLTILLPQLEIDYIVDIPGSVVPRKDGLVLGGTWESERH